MSSPPSPLASLHARITDVRSVLAYSARRLHDGEPMLAAAHLETALAQLIELLADVVTLEPGELDGASLLQLGEPPAGPATPAAGGSPQSPAALGRAWPPSVAPTPTSGYADEPLF